MLKLEQAKDASYTYNKTYRCYGSSLSNLSAMSINVGLVIFLKEAFQRYKKIYNQIYKYTMYKIYVYKAQIFDDYECLYWCL